MKHFSSDAISHEVWLKKRIFIHFEAFKTLAMYTRAKYADVLIARVQIGNFTGCMQWASLEFNCLYSVHYMTFWGHHFKCFDHAQLADYKNKHCLDWQFKLHETKTICYWLTFVASPSSYAKRKRSSWEFEGFFISILCTSSPVKFGQIALKVVNDSSALGIIGSGLGRVLIYILRARSVLLRNPI